MMQDSSQVLSWILMEESHWVTVENIREYETYENLYKYYLGFIE